HRGTVPVLDIGPRPRKEVPVLLQALRGVQQGHGPVDGPGVRCVQRGRRNVRRACRAGGGRQRRQDGQGICKVEVGRQDGLAVQEL
ncbi:hypothetical protein EV182_002510, partial [Spiromyces aspiralis]